MTNIVYYAWQVIGENVKCGGDVEGTCTKSATVLLKNKATETKYELKQGGVVLVAGAEVALPYSHGNTL